MRSIVVLLAVTISFMTLSARADLCGQLAGVKGPNVEILRKQSRGAGDDVRFGMKIEDGKTAAVECDDVVLTGADSSAKLVLMNAKITIGPQTRFEIANTIKNENAAQPNVNLLSLTYGKLRALVNRRQKGQANFQIRTATAVVGVRGTDFFVGYDANAGVTDQATIDGSVEVSQPGGKSSVIVEGGNQVTLDATPQTTLKAVAIRDSIRNDIRVVSASARDDKDFTHPKAIEVLGKPETWVLEREKLPDRLKNLKDEY